MKKKRNRTPAHRVNRKQRAAAIRALASIVESPNAAEYVRAKAASALLGDKAATADDPIERDREAPRKYVILPAKNNDSTVRFGLWYEGQQIVFVPAGWPSELHPEAHYASAPKPAPDPRIAYRNRPEALALAAPDEGEGE